MASLSFIMDVTDDDPAGTRPRLDNKRDKDADNLARGHQLYGSPSNPQPDSRHVSSPDPAATEKDIDQATTPAGQTRRRGAASTRDTKSAAPTSQERTGARTRAAVAASSTSPSSPSRTASTTRQSTRRRSSASNESMDRPRYGPAPSSLPVGRRLQRPMPIHPAATQFTPKITPKTGRVSKAKKGLPVHVCDICNPPKTFTRAEHLRRHQLGHGEPRFQCSGCDRAFHRPDLLARHQQKHEHDGDEGPSRSGSAQQSPHPSPAAPPSFRARHSPGTPAPASASSPPPAELPPTPRAATGNQPNYSQLGNSAHGSNSAYGDASGTSSEDFSNRYTPTLSIVGPAQPSSFAGSYPDGLDEYPSRNGPPPIYVVTQGLELPAVQPTELPELHDASPWTSSASDSTYSTPSDVSRNPRTWTRGHRSPTSDWASSQRLSPYPRAASRGVPTSGQTIEGIPFASSYSTPQPPEHTYGSTLSVPSPMGYSAAAGASHHHASLGVSLTTRPHQHRHSNSLSSARSRTPPLGTSSHGNETLLVSAPGLSSHVDSITGIDRRKEVMTETHHDFLSSANLDTLDGLGLEGYGVSSSMASPGADNASHSSDIIAELDLALGGGCAMSTGPSMTIPLPGPVLAAIPRYLEIYWSQVAPVLPFVHRQSFEAAPEDVLRCAMAAVATQILDNPDDRTRGNQLHEFAWQEVKRVPQWSLQTMQAILLCEYFARFRGRKAVTRPSKPFESLYSRVLFFNPALLDHAMFATDQHLTVQERWRGWVDAESRRRLLAACIFCDGHAAIYQQQRRAQDSDTSAAFQPIPLFSWSTRLWEASSADEWVNIVSADPATLQPEYVPPLEHLTREDIMRRPRIDRMIILCALAQRLPRRHRPLPVTSLSADSSPTPEPDPHTHHHHHHHPAGSPAFPPNNHQTAVPRLLDAEDRIGTLFAHCAVANTYLALHHTPLRDLLAVGGDSWVFSQKVLPATSFVEHQKRLRLWVTSTSTSTTTSQNNTTGAGGDPLANLSVVRATVYAARAILGFLSREPPPLNQTQKQHTHPYHHHDVPGAGVADPGSGDCNGDGSGCGGEGKSAAAPWSLDMSDYWALYVCALICWAFCHHNHHPAGTSPALGGSAAGGGGSSSRPGSGTSSASARSAAAGGDDEAAVFGWLRMVAAEGARPEDVVRLRGRREAAGVVGLVRRRLESDCLGGRSRLYVDAVGVLRRLEDGAGWKAF